MTDYDFKLPSVRRSLSDINDFLENEIKRLDQISNGNALLARTFCVIAYFNSLPLDERAGILEKLMEYLLKLKNKIDGIAKEWRVDSYSLGVSWRGLELTLSFKPN